MKKKRMNPYGAALILLGVVVPFVAFFGALWQNHPDPSAVRPGEIGDLSIVLMQGTLMFRDADGEVHRMSEMPEEVFERDGQRIADEASFVAGRIEVRVLYIIIAGIIMIIAGAVLPPPGKKE